ncbi:MAG: DoxX family protein [Flavobacteriaceae bacterium]|jgi:uncharacterized membrane protein YphA (DoxX/SURF4 family)|nr:DoxX family protein [Flavobacteriaceae bacterium]
MKTFLRTAVALIFIASGFVKAVDVVGFSFKLEEYFSESVFNIKFLEEIVLPIAIFVVALELILGFMLLLKLHIKKTLAALIALCVFFAFLTFYSAYFNKVTDCGCFGDAVKFTPWQSFIKDIVLLLGLIVLWFLYRKNFKINEEKSSFRKTILVISMVATAFIISWGIFSEPMIDFRDYKIGTNIIAERLKIEENPPVYKVSYTMENSKTGEIKLVNQDDYVNDEQYWKEGTAWKILKGKDITEQTEEGYTSEISKFRIEDETGNDITDIILDAPKAAILFSYSPEKADKKSLEKAETKLSAEKNILIIGVSPDRNLFKKIPVGFMDATAIKTIARSNPSILILEKGKITEKMPAENY